MPQILELLQVQAGEESTWGTPVAPTVKLAGIEDISLSPQIGVANFPTLEGLAPVYTTSVMSAHGEGSISGLLTYDDIPYYVASLLGDATATGTGPYVRAYAAPSTAEVSSPRIMTLYYGDTSAGYSLTGGLATQLQITANSGDAARFSCNFIGETVESDAPAALSSRSVTQALSQHVSVWVDAWGGSIGVTPWDNCIVRNVTLDVQSNRQVYFSLGSVNPCGHYHTRFGGTLSLSVEWPGDSNKVKTEIDSFVGGTLVQKQIRVRFQNTATYILDIDFAGTLESISDLYEDTDGVSTVTMNFIGTDNSTLGNWLLINSTNNTATLV